MNEIRVLTVDDHALLREGIGAVLAVEPDCVVVGEAASGAEAIEAYRRLRPDITLMDLKLPDMHGADTILAIKREDPGARIIVLTTYKGEVQALRAFKAGASGYLLKGMLRSELVETIRCVHAGRMRIPPEVASDLAQGLAGQTLSRREVEILSLVSEGNSNREVGEALGVTEETVKAHMKRIMIKLNARDRTHAAALAIRRGFLME
jgi:DNA-binding NarL/FixJ family response regulator